MLSRMVVNDGVGDHRGQNGLSRWAIFKGLVRHKGVPVKGQLHELVSNSTLRRIIPVYHARTLCPGVAQFCTGMSRLVTHVHSGAMVLSRSDIIHPG